MRVRRSRTKWSSSFIIGPDGDSEECMVKCAMELFSKSDHNDDRIIGKRGLANREVRLGTRLARTISSSVFVRNLSTKCPVQGALACLRVHKQNATPVLLAAYDNQSYPELGNTSYDSPSQY